MAIMDVTLKWKIPSATLSKLEIVYYTIHYCTKCLQKHESRNTQQWVVALVRCSYIRIDHPLQWLWTYWLHFYANMIEKG